MSNHLIIGAGAIGTATALELARRGDHVTIVTRSGSGPDHEAIAKVAADASDADVIAGLAGGMDSIINCANPPYDRWEHDWPPIAAALLAAAERSGAVLATMSNLYGYGHVDAPMTESTPLSATGTKGRVRADMWRQALAAHEAGRVRAVEARAGDFFGPGVRNAHIGERSMPRLLAGRSVQAIGRTDQPHTWSYAPDVGATLATLVATPEAWGRAWHVPSEPPLTQAEVFARLAEAGGLPPAKVTALPSFMLRAAGWFVPMMRELRETEHQFAKPFVMDSRAAQEAFGLAPTPYPESLPATVEWWRRELA